MTTFITLVVLNAIASLASAIWALVALRYPSSMSGSDTPSKGELFYARMYAARAVPFELMAGLLPFWPGGMAGTYFVLAAAVIQLFDVGIGAAKHDGRMVAGASLGFIVHLLCGTELILRW